MTHFAFAPASHLAALVRRREVGCLELLDYFIARVGEPIIDRDRVFDVPRS